MLRACRVAPVRRVWRAVAATVLDIDVAVLTLDPTDEEVILEPFCAHDAARGRPAGIDRLNYGEQY